MVDKTSREALLGMCVGPEEARNRIAQRLESERAESIQSLQRQNEREISDLNWKEIASTKNILYSAGTLALAGSVVAPIIYLTETGHKTGAEMYAGIPGFFLAGCTFMSLWGTIKQVHPSVTRPRREREERSRSIQAYEQRISGLEKELGILAGASTNPTKDELYHLVEGVFIRDTPEDLRKYGRRVVPVDSEEEISALEKETLLFVYGADVVEAKDVHKDPWTTESYPDATPGDSSYYPDYDHPDYHYHKGFDMTYLVLEHRSVTIPFAFHDRLMGEELLGRNVMALGIIYREFDKMYQYDSNGDIIDKTIERIPCLGNIYGGDGNTLLFSSEHWKKKEYHLESSTNCPFAVEPIIIS